MNIQTLNSLEHSSSVTSSNRLVKIDDSHFVLAYTGLDGDGYIKTFSIDSNFIISEIDILEHDTSNAGAGSLEKIDDTHFIFVYPGASNHGTIKIFSIDENYEITQESSLVFLSSAISSPSVTIMSAGIFAIAYTDPAINAQGYVKLFSFNESYVVSEISSLLFEENYAIWTKARKIDEETLLVTYSTISYGNYVISIKINTDYSISVLFKRNIDITADFSSGGESVLISRTRLLVANDNKFYLIKVDNVYDFLVESSLVYESTSCSYHSIVVINESKVTLATKIMPSGSDLIKTFSIEGTEITQTGEEEVYLGVLHNSLLNISGDYYIIATTGALGVGIINTFTYISPVSDGWTRVSVKLNVPVGTSYLRAMLSTSGMLMKFDDLQLEKSLSITDIEEDFVGDLILPKRSIKAEVGFNNYNIPKFTGLTNKFIPKLKDSTVQIYGYDLADRLKDILVEDLYFENKRTDELIVELASLAGIGIAQMSLETGTNTVEFAYFQEASVWTYMNQIAEAEGGRVFFDETGRLTFWNRNHYRNNGNIAYTFSFNENMLDLSYDISKDKVKNRIYVKAYPQKKLSNVRIYNDTSALSISPGDTQEFFCQYNYLQETTVPALNVQVPNVGTDIIANSAEDGTGSNLTSSISITSSSIFRESMRINLHNSSASTAYLTRFRIYGDPIVIARRIEQIKEDTEAQAVYDVQELQIENNFITTDEFAESLANQKLAELKNPRDFIKIDVVGVPYLQLGDKVSVQRSMGGEYEDFHIVKNSWSFSDDFIQSLELEKKVIT